MEDKLINLEELMYALKKRMKLIILCTVAITAVSVFIAFFKMDTSYQGRVKIFAGKTEEIQTSYSKDDIANYSTMMNTYIQLAKTEDFMNEIIKKADLKMDPVHLMNSISFTQVGGAPILDIRYTSHSKKIAKDIITILTKEFDEKVSEVILNTYTEVIDSVKVDTIVPNKPKVIIVGLIVGIVLAIGLALVIDYFDDTLVGKEELEKIIPIPVIGEISNEEIDKKTMKKSREEEEINNVYNEKKSKVFINRGIQSIKDKFRIFLHR